MNSRVERQSQIHQLQISAEDLTEGRVIYANNMRLFVGANEITIDFYLLTPVPTGDDVSVKSQKVCRLMLPLGVAKEMGEIMLANLEQWENLMGVSLPFAPPQQAGEVSPQEMDDNQ